MIKNLKKGKALIVARTLEKSQCVYVTPSIGETAYDKKIISIVLPWV